MLLILSPTLLPHLLPPHLTTGWDSELREAGGQEDEERDDGGQSDAEGQSDDGGVDDVRKEEQGPG
jgi:hypothetical protein